MARRLRVQYPGARYHVINRGNYCRDVFETAGAAKAFEVTLEEACERHSWRLHAYAIMRNHFHLALETPEPNLVEGMHWLQSTYATRFNRYRSEHGHLFQGRYQSPLLEDAAVLVRVIDYIHLNPVRAGIVPPAQVGQFRWSSLSRLMKPSRPCWLFASDLLEQLRLPDTSEGWARYVSRLVSIDANSDVMAREEEELTTGWAIGSHGWRQAMAREHSHLASCPGVDSAALREIKNAKWSDLLRGILEELGKNERDIAADSKGAPWKVAAAMWLRRQGGAPHRWIARTLNMGKSSSVRAYVCRAQSNCAAPVE